MKIKDHLDSFEEHKEIIDLVVSIRGLEKSQRTIGLHSSRAIVELLSAYLHEKNLITLGTQLNHRWFKSKSVSEKLPNFPKKEIIINNMMNLENLSEDLAYGSPKSIELIKKNLLLLNKINEQIQELRK
ncbi:MAG: hypothetical protein ABIG37_03645 [Nanoarchaeota archaeon]|nr:hypothetical protein [Nanoarchaeota archaeon]